MVWLICIMRERKGYCGALERTPNPDLGCQGKETSKLRPEDKYGQPRKEWEREFRLKRNSMCRGVEEA